MLFFIQYTDKPDGLPIREQYSEQHVAWLKAHAPAEQSRSRVAETA